MLLLLRVHRVEMVECNNAEDHTTPQHKAMPTEHQPCTPSGLHRLILPIMISPMNGRKMTALKRTAHGVEWRDAVEQPWSIEYNSRHTPQATCGHMHTTQYSNGQ